MFSELFSINMNFVLFGIGLLQKLFLFRKEICLDAIYDGGKLEKKV